MKKEVADSMSLQDFVDFCVKKTAEQGVQCKVMYLGSTTAGPGSCKYGDGEGKHCLVGWGCDEDEPKLMDHIGGVDSLVSSHPHLVPQHLHDNLQLFIALQDVHDLNYDESMRISCIRKIRLRFGINTSGEHWKLLAKLRNT